jgi:rhodanese-related sulfurtransferase
MNSKCYAFVLAVTLTLVAPLVWAVDVKLTPEKDYVEVIHKGKLIKIQRIQDQEHTLTGGFAKTSRKCPPFCIQPIRPAPGVTTVGEAEIFEFMETKLLDDKGVLIDARTPAWHKRGTIPGSVNIPFTVFEKDKDDPELIEVMKRLGGYRRGEVNEVVRSIEKLGFLDGDLKNDDWDFSNAKDLLLWCNGIWCGQSPRAIRDLLKLGYPAEKIYYYRGGMQAWQILGLTTIAGD